jgi:ElaB/YqjD/DUF883 family membrane-anchored ribosome-binding protein
MASNPKSDLEAAIEPAKDEVAALRADLAELTGMVTRIGKERVAGLKSAANTAATEGYARGEHAVDAMMAELQNLEEELADATRRRPFAALGLAALFGFMVGVLFRR